ncbi:MAG TPA: CopG family transcriptional regulator [Clostridia bacterium]
MNDKFVINPKEDKTITMTIRVDKSIQEKFDELSKKSNRSTSELISLALDYTLQNVIFLEEANEK